MTTGHPPSQGQVGIAQPPGHAMPPHVHPMVSTPGAVQPGQGGPLMSGAMPAGPGTPSAGGPSAHALSHLNPGQAQQLLQQQHMNQARKLCPLSVETLCHISRLR